MHFVVCGGHWIYVFPERWIYPQAKLIMAKLINDSSQESLKKKVSRNMEDNPDIISNCHKLQIN